MVEPQPSRAIKPDEIAAIVLGVLTIGGALYLALRGPIPLTSASDAGWKTIDFSIALVPMIGLYAGYLTANYVIFGLYLKLDGRSARDYIRHHWRAITLLTYSIAGMRR